VIFGNEIERESTNTSIFQTQLCRTLSLYVTKSICTKYLVNKRTSQN